MHTDRDMTRIVRSWMDEGATALPERVLDAVLDQVPTTPQRRSWWPSRRSTDMNSTLKVALGAVAVIVIALVGFNLLPRSGEVGGQAVPSATSIPTEAPLATDTTSASQSAAASLPSGPMQPGTYRIDDPADTAVPFTVTVPAGWSGRSDGYVHKNADSPGELGLSPFNVTHVYTDACDSEGTLTEIGPTVDDLLQALADQAGSDASTPEDVTLGGYAAKRVDMSIPADLDMSTCRAPDILIQIWADPAETSFFAIPVEDEPRVFPVYIADVDGQRAVFLAGNAPNAVSSPSDIAELDAIIASIEFQP
jgi:hypothetical protein